jgi:hypothetical protein
MSKSKINPKERSNILPKDKRLYIRIPVELFAGFQSFCKNNNVNTSIMVRHLIETVALNHHLINGDYEKMVRKNFDKVKIKNQVIANFREILPEWFPESANPA